MLGILRFKFSDFWTHHESRDDLVVIDNAALDQYGGIAIRLEAFLQYLETDPGINVFTAGKNIDGSVAKFWPGVDCEVGFSDNDCTTDTPWIKGVENRVDDCSATFVGGVNHQFFNKLGVV